MRNFKLLLATTAILSTALAMNVKADDPITTTLSVHTAIIIPDTITPLQNIDFGTFVLDTIEPETSFNKTMDPATGSINDDGARMIGEQKNGQVLLGMRSSSLKTISLPSYINLSSGMGRIKYTPNFVEIDSESNGAFVKKIYGIGGTLSAGAISMGYPFDTGEYTGELIVTVIEDAGE